MATSVSDSWMPMLSEAWILPSRTYVQHDMAEVASAW